MVIFFFVDHQRINAIYVCVSMTFAVILLCLGVLNK